MENAMAGFCCRVPKSHQEMERPLYYKIRDYIGEQSNHEGHLGEH